MTFPKVWIGISLLTYAFVVATSQECPKGWKKFGNSCYLFALPTFQFRQKTWENARSHCLGYGADLVSILNSTEMDFLYNNTFKYGDRWSALYWIGLFRNKTTSNPKDGWEWSDGNNFTELKLWKLGEPNNNQNNENCAIYHGKTKNWRDCKCSDKFAYICKRSKGLPRPTTPTLGTISPTKSDSLSCDLEWIAYNRSCYRFFEAKRMWKGAKDACGYTGGHLVKIENADEQHFLAFIARAKKTSFWIGLTKHNKTSPWLWEFLPNDMSSFTNWQPGQPNGLGTQLCVEMDGFFQPGLWNDANCHGTKSYICEKEEGRNICPDGWIPHNDICYQFNMFPSQKMTWSDAETSCNAVDHFSSLVKISSQSEHDFIKGMVHVYSSSNVWIGLNDITRENVFEWTSDKSILDVNGFKIWTNGKPVENKKELDCVAIMGLRVDAAWTVQNCSQLQNYICMRHRDLPYCNVPLGMENGRILDRQITASSFQPSHEPKQARFRHSGSWCPGIKNKKEYLQVELLYLSDVRKIITEGSVLSYIVRTSIDGETFKDYKTYGGKELTPSNSKSFQYLNTKSLVAKFVRIYPIRWNTSTYPCLRVDFIGCRAEVPQSTICEGKNWIKGPDNLCLQFNSVQKSWTDARSTCLERGGDLLSIFSNEDIHQLKPLFLKYVHDYHWIALNELDYKKTYYWSNTDVTGYMDWGSGTSNDVFYKPTRTQCVTLKANKFSFKNEDCAYHFPFICMKGERSLGKDVVQSGPTGVWMSSAKYYWPLSDDEVVLGTRSGELNGNITLATGVKGKPNSALQFSGEGSFIDVGKFDKECFGNPDYCLALTLSFMAWFDDSSVSSTRRLNILDSIDGDETTSNGLGVYLEKNEMYFVISKTSNYFKSSISIVANEWRHYVMIFNESSGMSIFVNGQIVPSVGSTGKVNTDKSTSSFKIGLYRSPLKSNKIMMAMIAFWDKMLPMNDVFFIYSTEFGSCPYTWIEFGMSCYQINKFSLSHHSAQKTCQKYGGDLITAENNVEQAFLTSVQLKYKVDLVWIGAKYKRKSSQFVDNDDQPIVYSNWKSYRPLHLSANRCVQAEVGKEWSDEYCGDSKKFICEKRKAIALGRKNSSFSNSSSSVNPITTINKFHTLCHYTRFEIGCPDNLLINITSAFWGRKDKKTCYYISVQPCGVDDTDAVTKNIMRKCNGLGFCDLFASQSEPYLTNPCPTVHKYLQVNYSCVRDYDKDILTSGWKNCNHNKRRCYRLYDTPKSWKDARTTCKELGGELISIVDRFEQSYITSLLERAWYQNIWIGLNDLTSKGVYEWSDGSEVSWTNWYVGQPDERLLQSSCVSMSLHRGKRGWMFWSDENCTKEYPFMCKVDLTPVSNSTLPTRASDRKKRCYNAYVNNKMDYCYFFDRWVSKNWIDANIYCQDKHGASLVSVHSDEENAFVMKISRDSMWLGLESRGVFRGNAWSDGTPVNYTNWEIGQPDSYNGLEACVQINPESGRWTDRDCNEKKKFVCKKRKDVVSKTSRRKTYPKPGSRYCRKGWTLYKRMCYIAVKDDTDEYVSWHEAENRCQKMGNGGHLVSLHNEEEDDFMDHLVGYTHSSNFWIGLNDLSTEAQYKWSDGSNYNYANWEERQPDDKHRQENCVSTSLYSFSDRHCQLKLPYICKSYNESYTPPVRPTELLRPSVDEYCPDGWVAHAKYCYEFHTDPREYRTWEEARDACELGHNSSAYGELVSIHDEFEEAFITLHLKGLKQPLWIGLNAKYRPRTYYWSDNSPSDYFKWHKGEPSLWFGGSDCVEILPYRWAAGKWKTNYCSSKNGFICKKAAQKTTVRPPKKQKDPKCKIGYKNYHKSCFKFVYSQLTFFDARKFCQNDGGDLMIVDNQFKQAYLTYLLQRFVGIVWIGYIHEPYSVFKFVDNSLAAHTNWGPGQPNRQLQQQSCVQANFAGLNIGFWDDVECSTTNSFVCEIYKGDPKVTIPLNGTCPSDWKYFNKHCYKYFTSEVQWSTAQYTCSKGGANLLSIHDDREQDFLIYYLQQKSRRWLWTGLNDISVERGYEWEDKSALDYINWDDNEPDDNSRSKNCVEMKSISGKWKHQSCSSWRSFICKRKLECSGDIPIDTSMVTVTDTRNSTTMGADKAIFTNENDSHTWCTNNTSGNSKIMINFDQLYRVTGITVTGFGQKYVKSFSIEYEHDESWRVYYPKNDYQNAIHQFSSAPSRTTFRYPFKADGIKITPITWNGGEICMKIKLHGCSYVCQKQLFMSYPTRVKDNVITASSAKYPTHEPKQTAIVGHAWCAEKNDKNQWIQFKFARESKVSTIRTFGDRRKSYVKSYYMQFSDDGKNWSNYVQLGTTRIFQGNNEANSPVRHTLANEIEATYVRVLPVSWKHNICMRISLLGCYADCNKPLLASKRIPNPRFDSSDKNSHPEYALFNTGKAWCTGKSQIQDQFLEMQFGGQYILSTIATLPGPVGYKNASEISSFIMKYKKGKNWFVYGPRGQAKIMLAINENDRSKPKTNHLTDYYRNRKSLRTKGIRIYPKTFDGSPACIRVEFYGCPAGVQIPRKTHSTSQDIVYVFIRFTSLTWDDKLSDHKSNEFHTMSINIIKAIENVYSERKSFRNAEVIELTKGSVWANIKLVFNPEFADGENVTSNLANAVKMGKVGDLDVDPLSFKRTYGEIPTKTKRESNSGLSHGALAGVIVVTVLVVLAVAIILAFFVYRYKKQKNLFAPKYSDIPMLYLSKDHDSES